MRWKIHKLGFLNFWLYDEEEFVLDDGHILLRGNNASGKSITTQSFIPFILDGNRRPERLDPFGSRDRKMDFYLLGDGEREDSTGYLYLEFRKSDVEEYRTIGIGMRAQQGKGVTNFWGFCLADGRRIGPDGLSLCQREEGQIIPLTQRQLRDRVHDENRWAETPDDYKAMVNREIFGFQDIREYEQLIQILMKVRAPKLSKDAMRPTEVKNILRDSLQVLTDADLSAMIATMERMDQLEDTLQDYRAAMQDVQIILNEYNRYNQYMLGMKGRSYLDARQEALRQQKSLSEQRERMRSLGQELEQLSARKEETARLLELAAVRRRSMGEDTLSRMQERLEEHGKRCAEQRERVEQGGRELDAFRAQIAEKQAACADRKREAEEAGAELREAVRELEAANHILDLGEEHQRYLRTLEREETGEDSGQAAADPTKRAKKALSLELERRKTQIREVLRKFQRMEFARKAYEEACGRLDQAERACRERQEVLNDAAEQERREQSRLTEALIRWKQENRQLRFSPEEWQALRQALLQYQGPADWASIRETADECARRCGNGLQTEKLSGETALHALEEEAREVRKEWDCLREQKDPVPPRRDAVLSARQRLSRQGVPCAAFYETIDFAPELSQPERDMLEAQLRDAGLLDALIVPEASMDALEEVLAAYPDCFLLPGPAVEQPVSALIPDRDSPFYAEAAACLRGISSTDLEAETALLADGSFRCGMIRGHSHPEEPAGFIGVEARRKNRERLLRRLQERLEQLDTRIDDLRSSVNALAASLERLEEERRGMPGADDWNHAMEMRREAEQDLTRSERDREDARRREADGRQAVAVLDREIRESALGFPYGLTLPGWEEAQDAAEEYQNILSAAGQAVTHLRAAKSLEQTAAASVEEQIRWAADKEQSVNAMRRDWEREQAAAAAIQAELDRPENQERARRLRELNQEIAELERENRAVSDRGIALEEKRKSLETSVEQTEAFWKAAEETARECAAYFSEDLRLGFSGLREEDGMESCAKRAAEAMPASVRGRTPEEMGDALRKNFQDHNNSLLKYHAENRMLFDPPENRALLRQRLCIYLRMGGKELSLYGFAEALQKNLDEALVLLEKQDRELFENILMDTISRKLRARIEGSRQWAERMTEIMSSLNTSMGLTFSLDWKAREAEGETEIDTAELVRLLNKDRNLLTVRDSERVSEHFRSRVKRLREAAYLRGESPNYAELIHEALDYRNWYAFRLFYRREGENRRELTDRVFNRFSGGEKAMAMYVPLFASVSAHYRKAREDAPLLLALDEAFAGVDEKNISAMFDLLRILNFDYIMNSQSLWGCYARVRNLDIAELHRPANASVVTILRYHWNGLKLEAEDLP